MARSLGWLYPFLIAPLPVLNMVAAYPGQTSLDDVALIILVILAGCALLYVAAALVSQGRWCGRLPPLATFLGILWFYGYARAANFIEGLLGTGMHRVLVPLGVVLTVALASWLLRRPLWLDRLARFLVITGVLLVAQFGFRIAATQWRMAEAVRQSHLISWLAHPITVRPDAPRVGPRRDVYLIVLDEYPNSSVTEERFGIDNREFEDSLRRRGFFVPRLVRSNYMHTTLSLPSLLNAAHLTDLAAELGRGGADPSIPNYLVENNRTVAFLQRQGYRFIFFPSQWWLSTRHNRHADVEFQAWPQISMRELSRTELRRNVRSNTILNEFQLDLTDDVDHVLRTFDGLSQVPRLGGKVPTLAFAHIMKPHRPFAFDSRCQPRLRHAIRRSETAAAGPGYAGQLKCLNSLVLRLVDTLLRTSAVPPIILLQSDHGTKTLHASTAGSVAEISPAAARERLGAFGAYYLPEGGVTEFGDSVTVVNVLGNVLRYYFGADLPREPDDFYMSVSKAPYDFQRVDLAWLSARETILHVQGPAD